MWRAPQRLRKNIYLIGSHLFLVVFLVSAPCRRSTLFEGGTGCAFVGSFFVILSFRQKFLDGPMFSSVISCAVCDMAETGLAELA